MGASSTDKLSWHIWYVRVATCSCQYCCTCACSPRVQTVPHSCQVEHYRYIDGMPQLLQRLKDAGYDLHAMSNYPMW
jgi:phosphoglycolate phosphatase-like HAD superfamily hydrolase